MDQNKFSKIIPQSSHRKKKAKFSSAISLGPVFEEEKEDNSDGGNKDEVEISEEEEEDEDGGVGYEGDGDNDVVDVRNMLESRPPPTQVVLCSQWVPSAVASPDKTRDDIDENGISFTQPPGAGELKSNRKTNSKVNVENEIDGLFEILNREETPNNEKKSEGLSSQKQENVENKNMTPKTSSGGKKGEDGQISMQRISVSSVAVVGSRHRRKRRQREKEALTSTGMNRFNISKRRMKENRDIGCATLSSSSSSASLRRQKRRRTGPIASSSAEIMSENCKGKSDEEEGKKHDKRIDKGDEHFQDLLNKIQEHLETKDNQSQKQRVQPGNNQNSLDNSTEQQQQPQLPNRTALSLQPQQKNDSLRVSQQESTRLPVSSSKATGENSNSSSNKKDGSSNKSQTIAAKRTEEEDDDDDTYGTVLFNEADLAAMDSLVNAFITKPRTNATTTNTEQQQREHQQESTQKDGKAVATMAHTTIHPPKMAQQRQKKPQNSSQFSSKMNVAQNRSPPQPIVNQKSSLCNSAGTTTATVDEDDPYGDLPAINFDDMDRLIEEKIKSSSLSPSSQRPVNTPV